MGGLQVEMQATGMYLASFLDDPEEIVVKGDYSTDADTIYFEDVWGPLSCDDGEGSYRYTVDETELDLRTISDPCEDRNDALDGVWDRR